MRSGADEILIDFIALHHFAFCIVDASSEGHFSTFLQNYHGIHGSIFMQGLGQADELLVLNDGVGILLNAEDGAVVAARNGLVALNGRAGGVEDGSGEHVPVGIGQTECLASGEGAVEDGAKTMPGGLAVEESAGGELVGHGLEAGGSRCP